MLVRMAAERHIERDIELVLRALADPERDALQRLLVRLGFSNAGLAAALAALDARVVSLENA